MSTNENKLENPENANVTEGESEEIAEVKRCTILFSLRKVFFFESSHYS